MKLNDILDKQSLEDLPDGSGTGCGDLHCKVAIMLVDQYNQLEFGGNVEKLAEFIKDARESDNQEHGTWGYKEQAKYLLRNMHQWLTVRKGDV